MPRANMAAIQRMVEKETGAKLVEVETVPAYATAKQIERAVNKKLRAIEAGQYRLLFFKLEK